MSVQPPCCRAQTPASALPARLQTRTRSRNTSSAVAAPCLQQQVGRRRRSGSAGSATNGSRLQAAGAAAAQGQPPSPLEIDPTLVLAGFYIEEIASVRQLLDELGAAEVKLVPATPSRLHRPLHEVLQTPEPQWDRPVPEDWQAGGGWGQQPVLLMAGLDQQGANILLDLLEESMSASICPAFATPENLGAQLGDVLAAALKLWRQSGGSSGSSAAAAAAADAVEDPTADAVDGLQFVDQLPPVEELVAEPAEQAAGATGSTSDSKSQAVGGTGGSSDPRPASRQEAAKAEAGSGAASSAVDGGSSSSSSSSKGAAVKARQIGVSSAPEVVQAEFSERPAASPLSAAEEEGDDAAVPLDLIDAIASGSKPQGPTIGAAAPPAAHAARAEGAAEADSMSSEELLAAARSALGLDSLELQRIVDEAAAKAAAAAGVPLVPGDAADEADISAGLGSGSTGQAPAAAAAAVPARAVRPAPPKSSGSSSPKPWETPASAAGVSGATPGGGAKPGLPVTGKGFGRPPPPSRKAAKAARRQTRGSASGSSTAAGQPVAAAAQAASGPSQSSAAGSKQRQEPAEQQQEERAKQQRQQAEEEEKQRVLPPAEQFVLSRAQLREVTEKHGLDFKELLAGLEQRGIELTD